MRNVRDRSRAGFLIDCSMLLWRHFGNRAQKCQPYGCCRTPCACYFVDQGALHRRPPPTRGNVMQLTRRNMLATGASAFAAAAAAPAFAAWEESTRYPDPRIQILDPSFARYRVAQSSVERLYTGPPCGEGPVWLGDWRCLPWSDIPNNLTLRC